MAGVEVQNQVGRSLRGNLARRATCWTGRSHRALAASGRSPIAFVKRSISTMGVAAGSVRAGHGEDARRALGVAPSVRPGAQRAPRRRLHSRVKTSKQARKDSRAARVADVTLRYRQVALPCPGAAAVELWVVHAREEHPPPTAEPLE